MNDGFNSIDTYGEHCSKASFSKRMYKTLKMKKNISKYITSFIKEKFEYETKTNKTHKSTTKLMIPQNVSWTILARQILRLSCILPKEKDLN